MRKLPHIPKTTMAICNLSELSNISIISWIDGSDTWTTLTVWLKGIQERSHISPLEQETTIQNAYVGILINRNLSRSNMESDAHIITLILKFWNGIMKQSI